MISAAINTVTTMVDLEGDPGAVVVSPDGHHACVTNGGIGMVPVVDTGT
jgi:DNA-binding beta-propeller fold protein YncE